MEHITQDKNGNIISVSSFGTFSIIGNAEELSKMISPVKCNHCGKVYDLTTAKVNHRFMDCDQFTTPCCDYKFADTRPYKSFSDFRNIKNLLKWNS